MQVDVKAKAKAKAKVKAKAREPDGRNADRKRQAKSQNSTQRIQPISSVHGATLARLGCSSGQLGLLPSFPHSDSCILPPQTGNHRTDRRRRRLSIAHCTGRRSHQEEQQSSQKKTHASVSKVRREQEAARQAPFRSGFLSSGSGPDKNRTSDHTCGDTWSDPRASLELLVLVLAPFRCNSSEGLCTDAH